MNHCVQKLTAVFLGIFYALVGLTGESLHYIAQDIEHRLTEARPLSKSGYFHSHGPHDHTHFHRHAAPAEDSKTVDDSSAVACSFKKHQEFHEEHACPFLTLVNQLKQGHGLTRSTDVDCGRGFSTLQGYLASLYVRPVRILHVRGPPLLS